MARGWTFGGGGGFTPTKVSKDFDGSDGESVSLGSTMVVKNGSMQLGVADGSTATRPSDDSTYSPPDQWAGLVINPNVDTYGFKVTVSSQSTGMQEVRLADTDGNAITTKTPSGSTYSTGDVIEFTTGLTSGTSYYIQGYYSDSQYGYSSPSFPLTSSDIDITNGCTDSSTSSAALSFSDVTATLQSTSDNALIYWGLPSDITAWDLATFERTLANETVTVDIEDSNGNVLHSDISKDFDISGISSGTEVRIRAYLSRTDTNNNPTLDYAGIQYER